MEYVNIRVCVCVCVCACVCVWGGRVIGKTFCVFNLVKKNFFLSLARFVKGAVRASVMGFRRARVHTHARARTRTHLHTYTHSHIYTHTHTHTNMHTLPTSIEELFGFCMYEHNVRNFEKMCEVWKVEFLCVLCMKVSLCHILNRLVDFEEIW
jgi:hypothetical protein